MCMPSQRVLTSRAAETLHGRQYRAQFPPAAATLPSKPIRNSDIMDWAARNHIAISREWNRTNPRFPIA
jgi:hypothetical protein